MTQQQILDPQDPSLHDGKHDLVGHLGTGSLIFLIIAASAPLTVVAGGAPTSFAVTEMAGVPLGYLVLGIVILFFSVGYAAMSSRVTNAGAIYAYTAAGLGKRQGLAVAWLALVSYNAMQIGLYGIFGFVLAITLDAMAGITVSWWLCALTGWLLTAILGAMNIDASAKVIGVLVLLEFFIVGAVDFFALSTPADGYPMGGFDVPEFVSSPGVGAALAFGMAAFMGFESATIYTEETKNPRKTIPRATYGAVTIIALFYAFSVWAVQVGIGETLVIDKSIEMGPELVFWYLAETGHPVLADLGRVVFITSLFAALFAFHNAIARYILTLGREGVLPEFLGRTSPKTHAPIGGSLTQSALAFVCIIGFAAYGAVTGAPFEFPVIVMFGWLTNAGAFGIVFLLFITALSCVFFFRGDASINLFSRVISPVLAMIGLGFVFIEILIHFDVLVGAEGFSPLVIGMPTVILLTGVLGLIRGEWLRRNRPAVFDRIGTGHGVEFDNQHT
ncbi:APC family permease [Corynebacterium mendelii]|uniref:APC family permease n=1 Tax=Corynebacterium mendelii TaxID=2765362 RepID=A0A939DYA7_9CORY|nr:APC family permease [Corynebacterium mendelii]MBN9643213.1 APC family permease [Corynebacterium mendelii]